MTDLAGDLETPAPMVFEITTHGACGMNADPADQPHGCAGFVPACGRVDH